MVLKTFKTYFGKAPSEIFDAFNLTSIAAASIGQVHKAEKYGKKLAVKIQYPGVSESISSDLAMIKPLAMKMFNIQGKGSDIYFKEVEEKLLEETNYLLEVRESLDMAKACNGIENICFPNYYEELSSDRIITMDWMEGRHLTEFTSENTDKSLSNKLGQALWDFYMYQIHHLKKFHADPHPGNFLISKDNELVVLDFGCIKEIPDDFYFPYFELAKTENLENKDKFKANLYKLEILRSDDSPQEVEFFIGMFYDLLTLFTEPFQNDTFDFSNHTFFQKLSKLGEQYSKDTQLRNMNGNRGSRHFIYVNRTFFGLYNLMHELKADNIQINNYMPRIIQNNPLK